MIHRPFTYYPSVTKVNTESENKHLETFITISSSMVIFIWGQVVVARKGCSCGMRKFHGQVLDPCHSRDNARSLPRWATKELQQSLITMTIYWILQNVLISKGLEILFFFFFLLFRAAPTAYENPQARGWIGAAVAGPMPQPEQCQIQAEAATYTTAYSNTRSFNPLSGARDWTHILKDTVGVCYHWATMGTP